MSHEKSTPSPLVPNKDRACATTITFSSALSTTKPGEKWFVESNNQGNRNFQNKAVDVTIYDLRGQENAATIDSVGFQPATAPSAISADVLLSGNDAEIEKIYYPECEAVLKKYTGCSRVVFFDHTVRKLSGNPEVSVPADRKPVLIAHVDQTPASSHVRVDRHVQPPQPYKRFQLVNVWRPITNKVYDYPLTMCEAGSVDVENDLEPIALINPPPTPEGETYGVKYNKNQVWWYWSEMTPDDVIFLKCYDSASRELTKVTRSGADVAKEELRDVAGLTPHTAFFHAEGAKKGIPRMSIEVRALVFYD